MFVIAETLVYQTESSSKNSVSAEGGSKVSEDNSGTEG